jgi:fido (protein-threonine AMPylation protein)
LQGIEFHIAARFFQTERHHNEWNGLFVVGLHRRLFEKFFPTQAGRPRTGESIYGRRAGAAPEKLDGLLQQLALQLRDDLKSASKMRRDEAALVEHVFLAAARTHAEMINIHPFVDGNGRWARLLTSVFLRDAGLPCGTIILPQEKPQYINAIDRAIDEREPGDLANLLAKGFAIQASRREEGGHPR